MRCEANTTVTTSDVQPKNAELDMLASRVLVCISDSMLVLDRSKSKQWNVVTITYCPGVFDVTTGVP